MKYDEMENEWFADAEGGSRFNINFFTDKVIGISVNDADGDGALLQIGRGDTLDKFIEILTHYRDTGTFLTPMFDVVEELEAMVAAVVASKEPSKEYLLTSISSFVSGGSWSDLALSIRLVRELTVDACSQMAYDVEAVCPLESSLNAIEELVGGWKKPSWPTIHTYLCEALAFCIAQKVMAEHR